MPGALTGITVEEVAKNGQPVLLYNPSYKHWVFVSNDRRGQDNVVESHSYRNETRNQFVLQPVENGRYRIYNPDYKQWMFVSNDKDAPDHMVESHKYANEERNAFTFEHVGNNNYLIYNNTYGEYVFVSNSKLRGDNLVLSHPHRNEERNKFILQLLHDVEVVSVDYEVNKAITQAAVPVVLSSMTINNDSSEKQTTAFNVNEGVSETSNYSHTVGSSLKVGTTFSTGIPFIFEGKVNVDLTVSYSYTWGHSKTISQNFSSSFTLNCPPHTKVTGEAIVQKMNLTVPYKMTLKTSENKLFYSYGNWEGVCHYNLQFKVKSFPL